MDYETILKTVSSLTHLEKSYLLAMFFYKRENDGLNGREWDAHSHIFFEKEINAMISTATSRFDDAFDSKMENENEQT